jgi:hypothetical protein
VSEASFGTRLEIAKTDDEKQNVFGWANVSITKDGTLVVDHQDDIIELTDLEDAAYEFVLEYGETGDMHEGAATGNLIESMVFTPEKLERLGIEDGTVPLGWWVGFHLEDQVQYAKVKTGERAMFSIQGSAEREEVA